MPPTSPASQPCSPVVAVPPPSMRAVVARRYGGPEVLAIEEVPTPSPRRHELLVKVAASSLNALDWHFVTGTPYLLRVATASVMRPRRVIHGADIAGVVVAVGDDVSGFAVGDRVFGEGSGGGLAPYATVKAADMAHVPPGVAMQSAGATPVAGLTALQGLVTHGQVSAGDRVLINGAGGGVGTFAVQIATALGAEVTAVCSAGKLDMVRRLGADKVIDYQQQDFVDGGAQFDVFFDGVGNRSAADSMSVLVPSGRYVAVSGPKDNPWLDPMGHIAYKALRFWRSPQSFSQFTAKPNRADLDRLGHYLAGGQVVPEIQRVIGLAEVADALAEIGAGHATAKMVVDPQR